MLAAERCDLVWDAQYPLSLVDCISSLKAIPFGLVILSPDKMLAMYSPYRCFSHCARRSDLSAILD